MGDYRVVEWFGTDGDLESVWRLRYQVLVEEMGKYKAQADHERRFLLEPEDDHSWHAAAVANGGTVAAATRMSWGGDGLSSRQVEQYELQPWLDSGLAEHLAVGERAMVHPDHRGGDALLLLMDSDASALMRTRPVHVGIGACEPHLLPMYESQGLLPYADRHINSEEAGYLIPVLRFENGVDVLRGLGTHGLDEAGNAVLPPPVAKAVSGASGVVSQSATDLAEYRETVTSALTALANDTIGAFDDLTEDEVERCLARSTVLACDAGDRIVKAGGTGRSIFVVLEGTLEAKVGDKVVGVLSAGEAFGETAFLLDVPRSAHVDAATSDARVLCMSDKALKTMINEDPTVAAKFLRNLSRMLCARLVKANAGRA